MVSDVFYYCLLPKKMIQFDDIFFSRDLFVHVKLSVQENLSCAGGIA